MALCYSSMTKMADQSDHWRSQSFRQKVMAQIQEAIWQSGHPTNKTPVEMENHVFQKAQSKDEYLGLVARLILHLREIGSKAKQGGPGLTGQGTMAPGGPTPGIPDPINALQHLTRQEGPLTLAMLGNAPQLTNVTMAGPNPALSQALASQGITVPVSLPQNQPPGQQQSQTFGLQQRIRMQDMHPSPMQSSVQLQQLQQLQKLKQQQQQSPQQPPGQHPGKPNTPQSQLQGGGLGDPLLLTGQGPPPQGPSPFGSQGPTTIPRQDAPNQFLGQGSNSVQLSSHGSSAPSPAQQPPSSVSSSQMAVSPASYLPSPSSQIIPSPLGGSVGSQSMGRTPGTASAPSPGSALNTPSATGTAPSPASRNPPDDQMYLEKVKQLSKYIDPLRRMIARIDREEDKKKELSKMKNLLDILSDPSKRVPMDMLIKCEQVLEKLDFKLKPNDNSVGVLPLQPGQTREQNICHPLMDAIQNHIKSPMLNHTLQRTFGPAIAALHGSSLKCPSPPAKKRKIDDELMDIPDVLQGEIARLDQRFKVSLDPIQHSGSRTVHLICQLDDKNLPCVPPITITVPENYPQQTPQCDTSSEEYDSTPFLQAVQKALSARLMKMPDKFSVTLLLDTWEMSVRQACAPRPTVSSTTK